jgi:hypothetical protein
MESIEQTFNGSAGFGKRVTCQISRNGDLIHRVYLQATVPDFDTYVDYLGLRLIKNVEIEIGGQRINNLVGAEKHQAIPKLCSGMEKNFRGAHHTLPQMLVGVT